MTFPEKQSPFQFYPVAHYSVGQITNYQHNQNSETQDMGLTYILCNGHHERPTGGLAERRQSPEASASKKFRKGHHDKCADHRAIDRGNTSDENDQYRHDGDIKQGENHPGIDESHVVGVQGSGQSHHDSGNGKRNHFVINRADAHALCGFLVFANGHKIITQARAHQDFHGHNGARRYSEGDIIVGQL